MKSKKLLSIFLVLAMMLSMMVFPGAAAYAGKAPKLHEEAACGTHPAATHALISSVDESNVYFTLYDVDESKVESQSLPVSNFYGTPAAGEWWYCAPAAEAYSKCGDLHMKSTYLDTDSSDDTYSDTKSLEQNYTLRVSNTYSDVSKVKLEWSISDISATRTTTKTWDPDHLVWLDDSEDPAVDVDPVTATFKLTNLSSTEVDAKVEFEAIEDCNPEVEYSGVDEETLTVTLGTVVTADYEVDKTITHDATVTVTITPDEDFFKTATATSTATKYGTYTITLSEVAQCFAAGTQITMADGSKKNIEAIQAGEEVLSFNHESGEYEAQEVYFVYAGGSKGRGTQLSFSDGSKLTIVGEHDLFELESMNYVTLTRSNAGSMVGKHYYSVEAGEFVELEGVSGTASTNYYSLYVKNTFNCIANGMITVPDEVNYLLNVYSFNADLSADQAQLQQDIDTYGLYDYRADAPYSQAEYDMMNMKYVKIFIGKGLVSMEYLSGACDVFVGAR